MRLIDADAMKERIVDYTGIRKAEVIREWIDEQPTVSGWISVDDATPDKDGKYLTWHGQSPMIQAFGLTGAHLIGMSTWIEQKGGWWSIEMNRPIIGITYWQPLPEPPKEDDDETDVISASPHLLTLEEALSADECWIEGRNGACGYGDAMLTDDAERVEFFRPHTISTLDFYAYGKDWRCWSYRPTDEQRKAVKWE